MLDTADHTAPVPTAVGVRSDARRNTEAVRLAMVQRMRYKDRVCFASHATLAKDTGLSERTVRTCIQRLAADRQIERLDTLPSGRRVRSCVWRIRHGERRLPRKLPTTSLTGRPKTFRTPRFARGSAHPRPWRFPLVTELVPLTLPGLEPAPTAPVPAQKRTVTASVILSAAVDTMALHGVSAVPGRWKAIIGRQAKELLGDGFDPETILVAAVCALRRGEPHRMFWIAGDLALAKGGALMSRDEYRSQIADAALRLSIPADEYQALYGNRA